MRLSGAAVVLQRSQQWIERTSRRTNQVAAGDTEVRRCHRPEIPDQVVAQCQTNAVPRNGADAQQTQTADVGVRRSGVARHNRVLQIDRALHGLIANTAATGPSAVPEDRRITEEQRPAVIQQAAAAHSSPIR